MVAALTFTDAESNELDLNDGSNFVMRTIRGTGIPPLIHEAVKTPSRRGEQYIGAVLEPRFITLQLRLLGTTWANLQARRRSLVTAFNPMLGLGTLKWTPDATVYSIDCILERELGINERLGTKMDRATVSLRCPDPAWYNPAQQTNVFAITGGLEIPMTIPMSISALAESQVIDNTGDLATYPTITIPGAFTNPKLTNVTTGKVIHFSGLTVAGGEEFVVDMDAQTAKVDGTSVMQYRTSASEAWPLEPGENTVKFETSTGQATATVAWYVGYLGV